MLFANELSDELTDILESGDIDQAIAFLRNICRQDEHNAGAWELRGLLEAKLQRPKVALKCFERASLLAPLENWSSRMMAIQYIAIGKHELGVDLLHGLGVSGLLDIGMLRLLLHDLLHLGYPDRAASVVSWAIEHEPNNAILWHELSAIQSVLGEPPEICLASAARAVELMPQVVEFRVTMATLLIQIDQVQAAYEVTRQTVLENDIQLSCECCLWRLIHLFNCFDDHRCVAVCYRRLRMSCRRSIPEGTDNSQCNNRKL